METSHLASSKQNGFSRIDKWLSKANKQFQPILISQALFDVFHSDYNNCVALQKEQQPTQYIFFIFNDIIFHLSYCTKPFKTPKVTIIIKNVQ